MITDFQSTHSNSSSDSNYIDIAYSNNSLWRKGRRYNIVSSQDNKINLDNSGSVSGQPIDDLLSLPTVGKIIL